MATSRPFAYNTGSTISGTVQLGDLSIGYPTVGFQATGLEWWNGPDEDLGYIICGPVPSDTQPTPVTGVTASIEFWRSTSKTDLSFRQLVQSISGMLMSAEVAYDWLTSNGYWTSFNKNLWLVAEPNGSSAITPSITFHLLNDWDCNNIDPQKNVNNITFNYTAYTSGGTTYISGATFPINVRDYDVFPPLSDPIVYVSIDNVVCDLDLQLNVGLYYPMYDCITNNFIGSLYNTERAYNGSPGDWNTWYKAFYNGSNYFTYQNCNVGEDTYKTLATPSGTTYNFFNLTGYTSC